MKKKPAAEKKTNPATAPETDSSVAVNCAYVRMERTDSLKPNPRNPNTHPEDQIKLLANIIAKTGWRSPIVVSKRSGFVTKGHGRLMAAQMLGLKTVPVDFQDYPDEAAELADMVADNRIADLSDFDRAILKDILADLDNGANDMLMTGFDVAAIEALMTAVPPDMIGLLEAGAAMSASGDANVGPGQFSVTFVFDDDAKESVLGYIKTVGKETVASKIVEMSEKAGAE